MGIISRQYASRNEGTGLEIRKNITHVESKLLFKFLSMMLRKNAVGMQSSLTIDFVCKAYPDRRESVKKAAQKKQSTATPKLMQLLSEDKDEKVELTSEIHAKTTRPNPA